MSTPGAIAVYSGRGHQPQGVGERPWRGVYHHWSGDLGGLGNTLIERVAKSRGDLSRVVRELIDDAPHGWSSVAENKKYDPDDPGLPVSFDHTGNVAFVYVFDIDARRIDAFATHSNATGERIGAVSFAADGTATPVAFDLDPSELVVEAPLTGGERLSAEALQAMLKDLPPIRHDGFTMDWLRSSESADGGLNTVFVVIEWDDDHIRTVIEREVELVPPDVRSEPARVRNFIKVFTEIAAQHLATTNAFGLLSNNPLLRTQARSEDAFRRVLLGPSYFG